MPGQWLTSSVVSRSFSWAHWVLQGPVPTVTVLKNGSSLEPAGSDLCLTFLDSSLLRLTIGRPPCAADTPNCPPLTLFDPSVSSVFSWKTPSVYRHVLALLQPLHLSYIDFIPTEKENPYEDVDLKRKSMGRKSCLLESNRSWTTTDRKLNSPPQVTHNPAGINSPNVFSC